MSGAVEYLFNYLSLALRGGALAWKFYSNWSAAAVGVGTAAVAADALTTDVANSASLPPNGGDEDPKKGDLKAVEEKRLKKDGIDAHALKKDIVGSRGGQYNISVDSGTSEVYLTPVRRGASEPVNTGLKYGDLAKTYPLKKP